MTPARVLADQADRDAIRADLDATLVVEAAAGTGKTTELVARVLALLMTGRARLATMVAVTFTEKAAGEMKLRLRTEIEKARARAAPAERRRLDVALSELEAAHIGTIHSFCAEILRERPVEAEIDPLFSAADEGTQERIYDEAFDRWFQRELADPHEGVRRVLRKRFRDRESGGPRNLLWKAGLQLVDQRDFDAPWRRDPFDREGELDALLVRLRAVADLWEKANDKTWWLSQNLADLRRFVQELDRREALVSGRRDYDGLEEELRTLSRLRTWKYVGGWKQFGPGLQKQDVIDRRDAARVELGRVLTLCDADLAACLHADLRALVVEYTELKRRAGRLDFLDLLVVVRDLVVGRRQVREELQTRFSHVLVDEFQDTDPLQAEILLLLAADDPSETHYLRARPTPGKLFVVGDPKQSIYRFRRADVMLYEGIKRHLVQNGARLLHLSTSFRSAPSIQAAINASFAPRMQGSEDGSQAEYVPLEAFRPEPHGRPTLVALPVPRPYSDRSGKISSWAVSKSVPDAVGAFVDWLLHESGWTIGAGGEQVPIEARHVCLLFKRFVSFGDDVTRPYVRALETRRIPHVLVGGRSFYKREEVVALKNALTAVEWPDDELSVFATLRGPFFALTDEALLAYRHGAKVLHPMRRPDEAALDELTRPVADALEVLRSLHRGRNRRPIADSMAQLLERTRAHAGVAIWPTGEQSLANLLRLHDDARRFEAQGATSFRAFVRHLDDEEERGGGAEAPVVEEGTDGVRIMTVHKAKGLEFPVVILVDPAAPLSNERPSRYVDAARRLWAAPLAGSSPVELVENAGRVKRHDEEEAVRLAYVAATRARDLLVVPAVGDGPPGGDEANWWVSVLYPSLYPDRDNWRSPRSAPRCPPFGEDSVLERSERAERDGAISVRPGLHEPKQGEHGVVWWDPRALRLAAEEDAGLRQQRILAAGDERGQDAAGEREHAAWQARRSETLARGATPSRRVVVVTDAKEAEAIARPFADVAVAVERTDTPRDGRPRGKAFGVLVHALLAVVDLDASPGSVASAARVTGRLLGASDEDVAWAEKATLAALRHPLLRRAAKAETRREAPVALRQEDGTLLEGVLDLAFREEDGWVIVDFKTDADLEASRADYERQVRMYAGAVRAATGEAARGVLLGV